MSVYLREVAVTASLLVDLAKPARNGGVPDTQGFVLTMNQPRRFFIPMHRFAADPFGKFLLAQGYRQSRTFVLTLAHLGSLEGEK